MQNQPAGRMIERRQDFQGQTLSDRLADRLGALSPMVGVWLWQNPCWLSFRLNFLGAGFNAPIYGWIETAFGLKRPEVVVLYALGLKDGLAAKDICAATVFPKNTISRAIQMLLQRKLIRRATDRSDRRSFVLRLTEGGREVVDAVVPPMVERERAMLAALTAGEQHMLYELLTKMVVASGDWPANADPQEAS